jgi:23S rRNA pseudouridine955/2504/2580 synthase
VADRIAEQKTNAEHQNVFFALLVILQNLIYIFRQMKKFSILFENDEILLVNKDAGVAVQGGKGIFHSVDSDLAEQVGYKIFLVHRLDRETAGILLVAKNSRAASKWSAIFSSGKVKKEYAAICLGFPSIDGEKKSDGVFSGKIQVRGKFLEAKTFFRVEKSRKIEIPLDGGKIEPLEISLMHFTLGTGRMHQIRIQGAEFFCPVAGDDRHGDFKKNKIAQKIGIKKLQLAAVKLSIPVDGEMRSFEIPLPPHMEKIAQELFGRDLLTF